MGDIDWTLREIAQVERDNGRPNALAKALMREAQALEYEGRADGSTIPVLAPVLLSTLDATPPPALLLDRLDPVEQTILSGMGGVGKGALAASWIVRLTNDGIPVMILDYEGRGGEWARRIDGLGGDRSRVGYVAPLRERLGPIWDHAAQVKAKITEGTYIVIDSAVMACAGADPMDPATPSRFHEALEVIGHPTLTLAHVTKAGENRWPFGSIFWHNLARVSWSMEHKGEDVLLTCQKASNWAKPPAATVEMTWRDNVLREVWEQRAVIRLMDRIVEALADGPLSVSAIAEVLNDGVAKGEEVISTGRIRKVLSREVAGGNGRVTKAGDQWSVRPEAEE